MPLVLDGDTGIVGVLLTDANGNVTFDTNTLYVDAPNNRVGIGTTVPDGKLTVALENSNTPAFRLSSPTSGTDFAISSYNDANGTYVSMGVNHLFNVSGNDAVMDTNDKSAAIVLDGRNNGRIQFLTNSSGIATPRMTILQDGKVGIGIDSPDAKLNIAHSSDNLLTIQNNTYQSSGQNTEAAIRFKSTGSSDNERAKGGILFKNDGSAYGRGDLHFLVDSNDDNGNAVLADSKMVISHEGNVGVGTTSPSEKLTVNGIIASSSTGYSANVNTANFGLYTSGTNPTTYIQMPASGEFHVWKPSTAAALIVKNNGDVSIGSDHSGFSGWRVLNMRQVSTGALINFEEDDGTRASTFAAWGSALRYQTHIAGGYHKFETDASTNAFQINDNGHVVVNTHQFPNNPTGSKLNVFGNGEVLRLDGTGNTSRTLRFRGVSSANPGIIMADGSLEIMNEDANTSIGLLSERDITIKTTKSNGAAGHVKFYSYNTEIMRIDGGNNKVGIGMVPLADTTGTLHVGGGLSVGSGNHAGYHVFSQHEGNVPSNTTRDVLQFEGPAYARYMTVTISGYLCRKEQYFSGYQSWDGASNGNNVGSTVNGTTTFSNGTNSSDSRAKIQLECSAVSGTSGHPRYKLKLITGGVTGQLYDTTIVVKFYNPPYYPTYL